MPAVGAGVAWRGPSARGARWNQAAVPRPRVATGARPAWRAGVEMAQTELARLNPAGRSGVGVARERADIVE